MSDRPNFVLIMTDQQRADHLGCYGNPILKTPNIDRIADGGTRYDRHYVANPICAPNRASMLTGRMPSAHGVRSNGIPLSLDARTFVGELREAGYDTGLVGKAHFQNITGLEREFIPEAAKGVIDEEDRIREAFHRDLHGEQYQNENIRKWRSEQGHGVTLPYYGFDHVDLAIWHGDMVGGDYDHWLDERCPNHKELRGKENAEPDPRYVLPQAWRTRIPEEFSTSAFIGEKAVDFIKQRNGDTPFFLQVSFPDPHHPFTPPGKYWDMYDPDDIPLPASYGQGDTPLLEFMRKAQAEGTDMRHGQVPFAVTAREAQEAIALTYGMIALIDDQVGRILDVLDAKGLMDNTVLIFASDHGDMMGDHGIVLKGPLHYDGCIRAPLLWRDTTPASAPICSCLTSAIDLPASILGRAGVQPYYGMQGRSLPGIQGGPHEARDAVLIEDDRERIYLTFDEPQRLRTLVTNRYRMTVFRPMDYGELFDLQEDPLENVNLWAEPSAQEIRSRLSERLLYLLIDDDDWTPAMTGRA